MCMDEQQVRPEGKAFVAHLGFMHVWCGVSVISRKSALLYSASLGTGTA